MNPDREQLPVKLTFEQWLSEHVGAAEYARLRDQPQSLLNELYAADYDAYTRVFNKRLVEIIISTVRTPSGWRQA